MFVSASVRPMINGWIIYVFVIYLCLDSFAVCAFLSGEYKIQFSEQFTVYKDSST